MEVHIARLGLMEREPVSTETFAQHLKHSLAAVAVFEGDDKVIGESHQLAPSVEARLRHVLEPLVQHMVQVDVREHRRDHPALRGTSHRLVQGVLFEHPRLQPFVDHAPCDAVLDPQVEE